MRKLALTGLALVLVVGCSATSGSSAKRSADGSRPTPTGATATGSDSGASGGGAAAAAAAGGVPRFSHIVVVVEENHASSEVLGSRNAPYMNALARTGTVLTRSYAMRHPSYPNYLALFSGSMHGITDDSCPHYYRG